MCVRVCVCACVCMCVYVYMHLSLCCCVHMFLSINILTDTTPPLPPDIIISTQSPSLPVISVTPTSGPASDTPPS